MLVNNLEELSLISFVKISNKFSFFFATPETRKWIVEAEHCTWRGTIVKKEGNNLNLVLGGVLRELEIKAEVRQIEHNIELREDFKNMPDGKEIIEGIDSSLVERIKTEYLEAKLDD